MISLLLLHFAALLPCVAAAREEVRFSYAWRFHLGGGGDDAGSGPGNNWAAAFSQTTGPCSNMFPDPHRMTGSDCALACAYQPRCTAWYHDPSGRACAVAYGNSTCTPAKDNATATGGVRLAATPLQTAYEFARADLPEADSWPIVDAPHDALMDLNNSFSESGGDQRHGYRVRNVAWYRKTFTLPSDWAPAQNGGGAVLVRFEGVHHFAQLWMNGVYLGEHSSSYGAFTVRLDNVSGVEFGGLNVLAVRADGSYGSEHWYAGAGLIRHIAILRVPQVSFVESALYVPSELAESRVVQLSAELQNFDSGGGSVSATVLFAVVDGTGAELASGESAPVSVSGPAGNTAVASVSLTLPDTVKAWSISSPARYTVAASLRVAGVSVDAMNTTAGWRSTRWDPDQGFFLNGLKVKQRGFSHHNSFGGVGVAMPQRLDAFRVQAARALGANIHRMSHNPYREGLYDLLDALGVLVWNENRDMGPAYAFQMGEMAKRDRNHVAVVVNSLCNEVECTNLPSVGEEMVKLSKAVDPSRPTTANSNGADGLSAVIDVQGFSHAPNATFAKAHASSPAQPLVLSECCSCSTQRFPREETSDGCIYDQNSPGIDLDFVAGSLGVWTLIDYFGEPPGPWPFVSSSFGQLDLSGMPKPNAYVYAAMWRERVAASDAGRVALTPAPVARITDLLDQLSPGGGGVLVHGIVSTPFAELLVDGVSLGVQPSAGRVLQWAVKSPLSANCSSWPTPLNGVQCHGLSKVAAAANAKECEAAACSASAAAWQFERSLGCWIGSPAETPCKASKDAWVGAARAGAGAAVHNATLLARAADQSVVATHFLAAPLSSAPAALALVVDVPSTTTGTGTSLFQDGDDVALIRVATVDAAGSLVSVTPVNVTFSIESGPGRIAGVTSGDPASHEQPNGATVATFGGVARVIVQITADCASPLRDRINAIDTDGGKRTSVGPEGAPCVLGPVIVRASAPGFEDVTTLILTSSDPADAPLEATVRSFSTGAVAFLESFAG